jgi:penicillin-binding protein 1A
MMVPIGHRKAVYSLAALAVLGILASVALLHKWLEELPPVAALEEYTPSLTSRVYDVRGRQIAELFTERRALLPLSKIPVDLQNAVIGIEDDQFLRHWGIYPRGILRAAVRNFFSGRVVQGGSTITQQLAKLIFLTRERTLARKIKEFLLALQIERNFSKQEILQLYLNQVYFGQGAYGVQAAASIYFGKDVSQLSLGECALLAGLIRAPGAYNPFQHADKARQRRNVVLQRMREEGLITAREMNQTLREPIVTEKPPPFTTQAPYFVEYVRQELEPKYGFQLLWKGGLKVYTTLDLDFQRIAERVLEDHLSRFDQENEKRFEESVNPALIESSTGPQKVQGAFVALNVKTGAILAMVGGRDYKESQFNRAVQAHRQAGSTFKPFVWSTCLLNGMTATDLVDDAPLAYYFDGRDWRLLENVTDQYSLALATAPFAQSKDFKVWVPNDFDGKFLGTITLRRALEQSRNVCSIRLIERVGPAAVAQTAHACGVSSELDPVLSLGLGTSLVSPLEMANAFGTFADSGIHVKPFDVLRVEDAQGKILESNIPSETEGLTPQLAYLMTNLMKGVVERGTGHYARRLRRPLAGKTGTTQDNKDLWFVGFTPDVVAAAWMGFDDFTSLGRKDLTGGSTVVPWWTEIMEEELKNYPVRDFPVPDGIVFVKVDPDSGKLALPTCPKQYLEAYLKGAEPKEFCPIDHSRPSLPPPAAILPAGSVLPPATGQIPAPTPPPLSQQQPDAPPIIQ